MDFHLTKQQEILKKAARDFLANECPKQLVRLMEEDEKGYSPELWRKMAGLGWLGMIFPEKYGGGGGQFLDLVILLEEMGRALVPGPFIPTVMSGRAILESGNEPQRQEFLPEIGRGELILSLALSEPDVEYDAGAISTSAARADGERFVVNGTKLFVAYAPVADLMLCVARTRKMKRPEDGVSVFLVETKNTGISHTLLKTIAGDKQYEVIFDGVAVPRRNLVGKLNQGGATVAKIRNWGAVARCAEMVGAAQQVLEMTASYAKERVQFGRPIGSFQAIQHFCANMMIDVDTSRFLTYQAAWRLDENLPCALEISIAKAWVSQAGNRVMRTGHQIHGGIGFTMDHDMQLYYRRAKAWELAFGDADFHLGLVAQQLRL